MIRVLLLVLTASQVVVGAWALVAPASFFDGFAGGWVALLPPYNEHLVRDVGALSLALAVVLGAAAWTLERRSVIVAAAAFLVYTLPHLVFHQHHLDGFSTLGALLQQGGFVAQVLIAAAVVVLAGRRVRMET